MNKSFWQDKSVFITGHTGFKGSWLSLWLHRLGAHLHGYALNPPTSPSLYEVAKVDNVLKTDTRSDLADPDTLRKALYAARPEIVFHLAAQPLVRKSYLDPLETFATNVMGTAHLLEALRGLDTVQAVVIITTDKVYENREWPYPYREIDPLGGYDPYSSSKAAAEILVASYRSSFFTGESSPRVATARAGNVIGGGDWGEDRLVPDCLKAFTTNEPVRLRYPDSVRPWQHVLEPLSGYLQLAEALAGSAGASYACAWNFGPDAGNDATVVQVAEAAARLWSDRAKVEPIAGENHPHESGTLRLDITRARTVLGWTPRWNLDQALGQTVAWQRAWLARDDMQAFSMKQIALYENSGLL